MEKTLLSMPYDDCMVYLSHSQKNLELDSQTLLETAYSFKITNSLLSDLERFFNIRSKSIIPDRTSLNAPPPADLEQVLYLRAFNRISLEKEESDGSHYWVVLPATPEDMGIVSKAAARWKLEISEEDIMEYYQIHIKNRSLKDIVETLTQPKESFIDPTSSMQESLNGTAPLLESTLVKARRKALSTVLNDLETAGEVLPKKNLLHLESINTIYEMSNDGRSRGQSSKKKNNSPGHMRAGRHSFVENEARAQHTTTIDYRSIQLHKSVVNSNDGLQSPVKAPKMEGAEPAMIASESPFQKIGTRIKTIFGNFFKVQEKMNKSYEELNAEASNSHISFTFNGLQGPRQDSELQDLRKKSRSKSNYHSVEQHIGGSPDILIVDSVEEYQATAKDERDHLPHNIRDIYQSGQKKSITSDVRREHGGLKIQPPKRGGPPKPGSKQPAQYNRQQSSSQHQDHSGIHINESIKNNLMSRRPAHQSFYKPVDSQREQRLWTNMGSPTHLKHREEDYLDMHFEEDDSDHRKRTLLDSPDFLVHKRKLFPEPRIQNGSPEEEEVCDSEESDGVKTERRRHLSRPPSYQKWGGLSMPRRTSDEECEVERFSSSDDSRDNNIEDAFEKGVNKGKASVIGIKGKN